MFNGIIKKTGIIKKITMSRNNCQIEIQSNLKLSKKEIGSSISCSGTCLTLENINKNISKFFISNETYNKTIFKFSKKGDLINLEKPLLYGKRVSGHFVLGHVDTTATIENIKHIGKSWSMYFKVSPKYKKYLIYKGSVTINGVSLTIAKLSNKGFNIVVVPHTLKLTNLIYAKKNDFVNVEFDILGKYILNSIKLKKKATLV
jgi:riboflavin synthase